LKSRGNNNAAVYTATHFRICGVLAVYYKLSPSTLVYNRRKFMATVKIYRYEVYDIGADRSSVRPLRATREAIERLGGKMIVESCEEIDSMLLDGNGFVRDETPKCGENHG
jgi:hypothetical protein